MSQSTAPGLWDFFVAVRAAERCLEPPPRPAPPAAVRPEAIQAGLRQGIPAILSAPPHVEPAGLLAFAERLRALLAEHRPALRDGLSAIRDALAAAGDGDRSALAQCAVRGDTEQMLDWATRHGLAPEQLYFVLELAVRPFLAGYAALLADRLDLSVWRERYCPVCARRPSLGVIDPLNLKWLCCPGCSTRWATRRYQCALCGHDHRGRLEYLSAAELPAYRVEVCAECKGYTKFVDQRELGAPDPIDPFLLDAQTLALDVVAQERGYFRPETGRGEGGSGH